MWAQKISPKYENREATKCADVAAGRARLSAARLKAQSFTLMNESWWLELPRMYSRWLSYTMPSSPSSPECTYLRPPAARHHRDEHMDLITADAANTTSQHGASGFQHAHSDRGPAADDDGRWEGKFDEDVGARRVLPLVDLDPRLGPLLLPAPVVRRHPHRDRTQALGGRGSSAQKV